MHLTVKLPKQLRRLVEEYVETDTHVSVSDFVRDAIREKIYRDAPELYRGIFANPPTRRGTKNAE